VKRTARDWHVSYQKDDGFVLHVEEKSLLGKVAARLLLLTDMEWFGRYHNLPFCWINPWSWAWKVGVDTLTISWTTLNEDSTDLGDESQDHHHAIRFDRANLGSLWMGVGQRFLSFADSLERARDVAVFSLTNEQVRERLPEVWENFGFLVEDDDDDDDDDDEEEEAGVE
jgi:hypothetical protein